MYISLHIASGNFINYVYIDDKLGQITMDKRVYKPYGNVR